MNINQSIHTVFPKYILCLDNQCSDDLDLFEKSVHKILESGHFTNDLLHVKSTHRTMSNLHQYEEFQSLVKVIEQATMQFGTFLGYEPETCFRMTINNMWANSNDQGGYNFPHLHAGAVLSGVFYVKTPPNNSLVFFDSFSHVDTAPGRHGNGHDTQYFDCKPARLIMFRGDMLHAAPPQRDSGEKIAISFNVR